MKRLSRVKMKGDRTGWDLGPHIWEAQVARDRQGYGSGSGSSGPRGSGLDWTGPIHAVWDSAGLSKVFFGLLKMQNSLVPLSNCSELPKVTSLNIKSELLPFQPVQQRTSGARTLTDKLAQKVKTDKI